MQLILNARIFNCSIAIRTVMFYSVGKNDFISIWLIIRASQLFLNCASHGRHHFERTRAYIYRCALRFHKTRQSSSSFMPL